MVATKDSVQDRIARGAFDGSAFLWKTLLAVELGHLGAGPAATALNLDPDEFEVVRKWAYGRCAATARPKRAS